MNIYFMKDDTVYTLKKNIKYLKDYYKNDSPNWISEVTNVDNNFGLFKKEFEDFDLIISENPEKDDFQNMKIMYDHLKDLTDSQASDERLWAGLCHGKFWKYMQNRWPLPKKESDMDRFILQHYFFNNGNRSLVLNGLSRLWWYARLSYDETNENNPYELTEYLSKDINGKAYMFFGSNFSNNRELQRIFLYTIKSYEESNNIMLTREEFNEIRKSIVLWSGKVLIDALSAEDIKNKIKKELETINNNH